MARRPIFLPRDQCLPLVEEVSIEFEWYAGFSLTQARKRIASLHAAAAEQGITDVLEISSRSPEPLGVSLSAFNLNLEAGGERMPVECAYQGSKVFTKGGPYTDLYQATSREAKKDDRLRGSGDLVGFEFLGRPFPTEPKTAFYDWLYVRAVSQNPEQAQHLLRYMGFSDIAFNPKRSINCQARSAALYVSLCRRGTVERALTNRDYFIWLLSCGDSESLQVDGTPRQPTLL